jgi:hypothetical protein
LSKEAKEKINKILESPIQYEGHFEIVFDNLSQNEQERLLDWIIQCKEGKTAPISSHKVKDMLGFILKFSDTRFRAILTKKKNEYFIALYLDKHKYYERQRQILGI